MPRVRRCKYPNCHGFATMPNHYCDKHIEHEAEYQADRDKYRGIHRQSSKATTWKYNHVTRYRNETKAEQNRFYHTKQWQLLRHEVFERDYYLCQYCKINPGTIVDHIVPIEYDQSKMTDISNLVTCCRDCHAKKTRWEQKYYGTGLHGNLKKEAAKLTEVSLINKLMHAV